MSIVDTTNRATFQFRRLRHKARTRLMAGVDRLREYQASFKQHRLVGTQICVTGSCGKSTTTRLIARMLRQLGSVQIVGHPNWGRHLMRPHRKLSGPIDFMVQEVGANQPDAMRHVERSLRVDIAVVTAVGEDHGSQYRHRGMDIADAIAVEKGKLAAVVHARGTVCLNIDDHRVAAMAARVKGRVVRFGVGEGADFRAENVDAEWPGRLSFDLVTKDGRRRVTTRFVGRIMLTNVLGALAAVAAAGLDLDAAIASLATIEPVPQHMSIHRGDDGKTYILDTYKASYWSTEMLVEELKLYRAAKMTLVLGDLSDIRTDNGRKYRRLIRALAPMVDEVVLTARAAYYGRKLPDEGVGRIVIADTVEDVAAHLAGSDVELVLMKSTVSAGLDRAVHPAGIVVTRDEVDAD